MKNYFLLLFSIIIFSCNSDDNSNSNSDSDSNSDFIVGKWIAIKNFESGVEVDLNVCAFFVVYEFNSDFSLSTILINENQIPENVFCGIYDFEYYKWKKIDDDKYGVFHIKTPDHINITFTRNGIYLDEENHQVSNILRLKRYQQKTEQI